jgi:hypothetical protein
MSLLVAVLSILSNVLTSYLNNRSQERLKHEELSYSSKEKSVIMLAKATEDIMNATNVDELKTALYDLDNSRRTLSLYLPPELTRELTNQNVFIQLMYRDFIASKLKIGYRMTRTDETEKLKYLLKIEEVKDKVQNYLFPAGEEEMAAKPKYQIVK